MIETRKRSARGRMKTAAVLLTLGGLGGAAYGCSSDSTSPDEGAGGAGGGGGGGPACGTNINDPNKYPACDCAGSRCVPKSAVTTGVVGLLAPCATGVCVPDNIVAMGENLQLKTCTSVGNAEGRCASTCIGAVAGLAAYIPRDNCAADERCVPCFNPATGQETGLCGLGCDQKPMGNPVTFGKCCSNDGLCAPKSALPPELASALGKESCASADDVCVPAKPIATPGAKFSCCTISNAGSPDIQGACISACVIGAGPLGDQIPQGSCGANEKCVPCVNPVNNAKTGVCTDASGQPADACTP